MIGVDLTSSLEQEQAEVNPTEVAERALSAGRKVMFMIDDKVVPADQVSIPSRDS